MRIDLANEAATRSLGADLATALGDAGAVIYLQGGLGAGKSTLARALLRQLGVQGPIKSPTYTLMEPYPLPFGQALHLDLYRISDPEELHHIGLREHLGPDTLVLVEWPEQGAGSLPPADLAIRLSLADSGRRAQLRADTARGEALMRGLAPPQ